MMGSRLLLIIISRSLILRILLVGAEAVTETEFYYKPTSSPSHVPNLLAVQPSVSPPFTEPTSSDDNDYYNATYYHSNPTSSPFLSPQYSNTFFPSQEPTLNSTQFFYNFNSTLSNTSFPSQEPSSLPTLNSTQFFYNFNSTLPPTNITQNFFYNSTMNNTEYFNYNASAPPSQEPSHNPTIVLVPSSSLSPSPFQLFTELPTINSTEFDFNLTSSSPTSYSPSMVPLLVAPTDHPIQYPSMAPSHTTDVPNFDPSYSPTTAVPSSSFPTTAAPSLHPSQTDVPNSEPSQFPTTAVPSSSLPTTGIPSFSPSSQPTTAAPSSAPSYCPSSTVPTSAPSYYPTTTSTTPPSFRPSYGPTSGSPSHNPSSGPTSAVPSRPPSRSPTALPSTAPSTCPSAPSVAPTSSPSGPSLAPSSAAPSAKPSLFPTSATLVNITFASQQVISGLSSASYYSDQSRYSLTLRATIASCMTGLTPSNVAIVNVTDLPSSSSRRRLLAAPSSGIVSSYVVSVASQYSMIDLQSQLTASTATGLFNKQLTSFAMKYNAPSFVNATSKGLIILTTAPTKAPSAAPAAGTPSSPSPDNGLGPGPIAGLVIMSVVVAVLLCVGGYFYFTKFMTTEVIIYLASSSSSPSRDATVDTPRHPQGAVELQEGGLGLGSEDIIYHQDIVTLEEEDAIY